MQQQSLRNTRSVTRTTTIYILICQKTLDGFFFFFILCFKCRVRRSIFKGHEYLDSEKGPMIKDIKKYIKKKKKYDMFRTLVYGIFFLSLVIPLRKKKKIAYHIGSQNIPWYSFCKRKKKKKKTIIFSKAFFPRNPVPSDSMPFPPYTYTIFS